MKKIIVFCLLFSGCSYSVEKYEEISLYDYEYYTGYNAAINQFGENNFPIVDLNHKKITAYTKQDDNNGYADGYHKAVDMIYNSNDKNCPFVH